MISIHPTLWKWAAARAAEEGYDGGASGLIGALIFFDKALCRKHWLTLQLMNTPDELERAIREIEERDPMKGGPSWIDAQIRKMQAEETPNETPK